MPACSTGARPEPALPREPALHQLDCEPAGFAWIDATTRQQSVFASYTRRGRDPRDW